MCSTKKYKYCAAAAVTCPKKAGNITDVNYKMTLPQSFESIVIYFTEALSFFETHEYIFNFPNTKILLTKVLDEIDLDFVENLNVNNKNFDLNDFINKSSKYNDFLDKINKFTINYEFVVNDQNGEDLKAPLSVKKKHEIGYLADEIKQMCDANCIDTVVDFGSGLGYLDQILYERTSYNILGIECNNQHYVGAKKRQLAYHEKSKEKVKYVVHNIDENSSSFIENTLVEKFGPKSFCIVGLHACADLTVNALNIFLKMSAAKALILMSCCYHKMSTNGKVFNNFPLSNSLKEICKTRERNDFLQIPFLRLAAQPPSSGEVLEDLVFNLISRGILELYAHERSYKIKRKKRKPVNTKTLNRNFEIYAKNAQNNGFTLQCDGICNNEGSDNKAECVCSLTFDLEKLNGYWREFSTSTFQNKAAIFILMQRHLQSVFENFILFDRIVYLRENGVENCLVKKIVNDEISPRCLAIVAIKK